MKKFLVIISVVFLLFGIAASAQALMINYGWEDGNTILGTFSAIDAYNVSAPDPVHSGLSSLKLVDGGASGTPQAYVGLITGLNDGDIIDASFWVYDTVPGAAPSRPSARIWAHYINDASDINSYAGSASGNMTYSAGTGWSELSHSWTFDSGIDRIGLIIEVRTYSNAGDTVWIDDFSITAPSHATINNPEGTFIYLSPAPVPEPATMLLLGSGLMGLAGVIRRKRIKERIKSIS